jgi:hypothetical protein
MFAGTRAACLSRPQFGRLTKTPKHRRGGPWQPAHEREREFTATLPLYKALLATLYLAGRADPDLPVLTAIMVAFDLGSDLALASGALCG